MQRHDVASTLMRRCLNVSCPLGRGETTLTTTTTTYNSNNNTNTKMIIIIIMIIISMIIIKITIIIFIIIIIINIYRQTDCTGQFQRIVSYVRICAPSESPDQSAHSRSLIRIFTGCILNSIG